MEDHLKDLDALHKLSEYREYHVVKIDEEKL